MVCWFGIEYGFHSSHGSLQFVYSWCWGQYGLEFSHNLCCSIWKSPSIKFWKWIFFPWSLRSCQKDHRVSFVKPLICYASLQARLPTVGGTWLTEEAAERLQWLSLYWFAVVLCKGLLSSTYVEWSYSPWENLWCMGKGLPSRTYVEWSYSPREKLWCMYGLVFFCFDCWGYLSSYCEHIDLLCLEVKLLCAEVHWYVARSFSIPASWYRYSVVDVMQECN